jgi:hypothetical protein
MSRIKILKRAVATIANAQAAVNARALTTRTTLTMKHSRAAARNPYLRECLINPSFLRWSRG